MALYPKQPFGPSAPGNAGVRALGKAGGDWQRKVGTGFTAQTKGDFSRITTGGFEYLTEGRLDDLPSQPVQLAALMYQVPFLPGFGRPLAVNVGRGSYFGMFGYADGTTTAAHDYTIYPGRVNRLNSESYRRVAEAYYGSFYGASNFRGGVPFAQSQPSLGGQSRMLAPTPVFLRETAEGRESVALVPVLNGRIDPAGRELESPAVYVFPDREPAYGFNINVAAFARPRAEFFPFMPGAATENSLAFFMLEKFFYTEAATNSAGKQPKFWMIRAPGKNLGALAVSDLTVLFAGAYVPPPNLGSFPDNVDNYNPSVGAFENERNGDTMAFMQVLALPDNTLLLAYWVFCEGSTPDELGFVPGRDFRFRIARITLAPSVTAQVVLERTVSFTVGMGFFGTALRRYPKQRIQDIVHLGAGRVLARNVYGLGGPFLNSSTPIDAPRTPGEWPVAFMRSSDAGLTWTEFAPAGFDASMKNQHFGDFVVHRPRTAPTGDSDGVVLCTSWDATRLAYFVYESKDDGVTWVRKGQITKPKSFQRIDQDFADDGGGNFDQLLPGPDTTRPADITIPTRFGETQ